ncbi:hypothetical protein ZWY2020_056258, partial [Hordeum vulgare]
TTSDTPERNDYQSPCPTRAPLNAIIVAKQKPAPHLSKPCDEDAATHDKDAALHKSPSRVRLRADAPKEEKDARTPSSPSRGEEEHTSMTTLPRINTTPADVAVAVFDGDRSKDFSRSYAEHVPPRTSPTNHQLVRSTSN